MTLAALLGYVTVRHHEATMPTYRGTLPHERDVLRAKERLRSASDGCVTRGLARFAAETKPQYAHPAYAALSEVERLRWELAAKDDPRPTGLPRRHAQ